MYNNQTINNQTFNTQRKDKLVNVHQCCEMHVVKHNIFLLGQYMKKKYE